MHHMQFLTAADLAFPKPLVLGARAYDGSWGEPRAEFTGRVPGQEVNGSWKKLLAFGEYASFLICKLASQITYVTTPHR